MQLFGSQDGTNNYVFVDYNGTTNKLNTYSDEVQFNISSGGNLSKNHYSQDTDPSNSLVDLSFVLTHVSSGAGSKWDVSTNNTTLVLKDSSITVVEAPSFNATSDVAKKENIQTISGALESINELRGVTYNLKADEANKTHHGVIAQELEEIFPDMVAGEEGSKSVAYMEIIGVLVEAVKDLKKRVEELESK